MTGGSRVRPVREPLRSAFTDHRGERVVLLLETHGNGFEVGDTLPKKVVLTSEAVGDPRSVPPR